MATVADVTAAHAALSTKIDAGFADVQTTIATETAAVLARIGGLADIPQAVVDEVTALGVKFDAGIAAAKAAILAELP